MWTKTFCLKHFEQILIEEVLQRIKIQEFYKITKMFWMFHNLIGIIGRIVKRKSIIKNFVIRIIRRTWKTKKMNYSFKCKKVIKTVNIKSS